MNQIIITGTGSVAQIKDIIVKLNTKKYLLVCGKSFDLLPVNDYLEKLSATYVKFSDFSSNPLYEDVSKGVDLFNSEHFDAIIAIGGGSAIDVAKCIKLFSSMNTETNYLKQEFKENNIPLIAVPTTAGTGSESTRYSVIYYKGQKQSVAHNSIIPNYAILDSNLLKTLPIYQKKCAMLDALCQGIESWWSVNSTDESIEYSKKSVEMIVDNMDEYIFSNSEKAAEQIILAANYAGRAINITQTTAPHAMSYKLTSMYHLPHGHAVAVCLPFVWKYMTGNLDKQNDPRGADYIKDIFKKISRALGAKNTGEAIKIFMNILNKLEIKFPKSEDLSDLDQLTNSVNPERLSNNPVYLSKEALHKLYDDILNFERLVEI